MTYLIAETNYRPQMEATSKEWVSVKGAEHEAMTHPDICPTNECTFHNVPEDQ